MDVSILTDFSLLGLNVSFGLCHVAVMSADNMTNGVRIRISILQMSLSAEAAAGLPLSRPRAHRLGNDQVGPSCGRWLHHRSRNRAGPPPPNMFLGQGLPLQFIIIFNVFTMSIVIIIVLQMRIGSHSHDVLSWALWSPSVIKAVSPGDAHVERALCQMPP